MATSAATKQARKNVGPKVGRAPAKVQREQAANRREAGRAGLPKSEAKLGAFAERFCVEYVRCGLLEDAHRAAELALRVPLDTTGFFVETEKRTITVKGRKVDSKVMVITDHHGHTVSEADLRLASASNIYAMPEVKQRIRDLRAEAAKLVKVTAESLAVKLELVHDKALQLGQTQTAANCIAMEAKLFGIDTGGSNGGDGTPAPAVAVNVNIRDFTGKPATKD